jgi:hypothetical protein
LKSSSSSSSLPTSAIVSKRSRVDMVERQGMRACWNHDGDSARRDRNGDGGDEARRSWERERRGVEVYLGCRRAAVTSAASWKAFHALRASAAAFTICRARDVTEILSRALSSTAAAQTEVGKDRRRQGQKYFLGGITACLAGSIDPRTITGIWRDLSPLCLSPWPTATVYLDTTTHAAFA